MKQITKIKEIIEVTVIVDEDKPNAQEYLSEIRYNEKSFTDYGVKLPQNIAGGELGVKQYLKEVDRLNQERRKAIMGGLLIPEEDGLAKTDLLNQEYYNSLDFPRIYKCVKCGVEGDDEASFARYYDEARSWKKEWYCLDCISEIKKSKK